MKTDSALSLWFDCHVEEQPQRASSRAQLLEIETGIVDWDDTEMRAPFEILLWLWEDSRSIFSTAYARPLNGDVENYVALAHHRHPAIVRRWEGGGRNLSDDQYLRRHLPRVLPALLRRRLWGRVLWLDRELNLAQPETGVTRLYLGAGGQGSWFLPGLANRQNIHAEFEWQSANFLALLLESSEQQLLDWVYRQAEDLESELSFALNWISWGRTPAANEKRVALNLKFARDSPDELLHVLRLASECDPDFADWQTLRWEIAPLKAPAQSLGESQQWRTPFGARETPTESVFDGQQHRRLPPFSRRIREWAHEWFGVELNQELRARHRCVQQIRGELTLIVERQRAPSAHQQIEAFAQLRDFLAARVAGDELRALLKVS